MFIAYFLGALCAALVTNMLCNRREDKAIRHAQSPTAMNTVLLKLDTPDA